MPNLLRIVPSSALLREAELSLEKIKGGFPRALAAAINKTTAKGKTETRRSLGRVFTAKQAAFAKRLKVGRATAAKLYGDVAIVLKRPMSLKNFKHLDTRTKYGKKGQRGRGVRVEIVRGLQSDIFRNAFVARTNVKGQDGVEQIFERKNLADPKSKLKSLNTRTIAAMFRATGEDRRIADTMRSDLPRQVRSQIDRFVATRRVEGES